jgi:hypothetical protein
VQFAQHVVRDVAAGARLAVKEDWDISVAVADFLHEGAQFGDGFVRFGGSEIVVIVDRQDEAGSATLLLREGGQVAITGDAEDFHALVFQRLGQGANTQSGGVLGTKVFVDDDDGKTEAHDGSSG